MRRDDPDNMSDDELSHRMAVIVSLLCIICLITIWQIANPKSYVDKDAICQDGSLPSQKTHLTDLGMETRYICRQ